MRRETDVMLGKRRKIKGIHEIINRDQKKIRKRWRERRL